MPEAGITRAWAIAESSTAWDYYSKMKVTLPKPGQGTATTINYGEFSANYDYENGTAGLAAMGGGDVYIRTGSDFLAQAGTFGAGDLTIYSGGDVRGRFLNKKGQGELHSMGNIGAFSPDPKSRVQIELFDSQMNVTAPGEIQIGAVLNPTLASDNVDTYRSNFVNCTYTKDTSISLKAGTDVTLAGISPYYTKNSASSRQGLRNETVMPATVRVDAGRDINLLNNFTLTSSPKGKLSLIAGEDISGFNNGKNVTSLLMSDIAHEYWYGLFTISGTTEINGNWIVNRSANETYSNYHGKPTGASTIQNVEGGPLHRDDPESITINAGRDIRDLKLFLPKKAEVTAGRDILDINYEGQNIAAGDVSMIRAGRDISMTYVKDSEIRRTTAAA